MQRDCIEAFAIHQRMTTPLDDEDVLRVSPEVLEAVLDDQLVVLQTRTHVAQALNASAAMVWAAIDGRRTVAEIIELLEADTGVGRSELTRDARLALSQFLALEIAANDCGARYSRSTEPVTSELLQRSNRLLRQVEWATVLGPFQVAATTVVVRTNNVGLANELAATLDNFSRSEKPTNTTLSVLDCGEARQNRIRLYANGRRISSLPSPAQVTEVLSRQLNQIAASQSEGHVLLHAGAVERDGKVVVIAGDSGRGKSTLTAALLQRGFAYLTDEVVAIDVESLDVRSYAKHLDLSAGSIDLLGLEGLSEDAPSAKQPVSPSLFGSTARGGRLALVVMLADPSAENIPPPSDLSPPVATLVDLLVPVFASSTREPRCLDALATIVESIPVVRLPRLPLDEACDRIEAAFTAS